jgi:hypothetical protein
MQPIDINNQRLEPQPFDPKKLRELLNDPNIKEVAVFMPKRGMKLDIRGSKYRILSVSKKGDLHLEKIG